MYDAVSLNNKNWYSFTFNYIFYFLNKEIVIVNNTVNNDRIITIEQSDLITDKSFPNKALIYFML